MTDVNYGGCAASLGGSEVSWLTLPCENQEFAGFFMICVFAYIVYMASALLCSGLENLDDTMIAYAKKHPSNSCAKNFKQIIGGVLSPTLGAFPDAIMISVTTKTQADVAAGMTMLVSSNALLLTVPWFIALFVGRKNLNKSGGLVTTVNTKPLNSLSEKKGWTHSGVMMWTSVMDQAQVMLITLFPFILAQFLAFILSEERMKTACIVLACICVGVYVCLLWFQLSDISGTSKVFEDYREAIKKFENQMMWIRATGFYGAASQEELNRMFLKAQLQSGKFAAVDVMKGMNSKIDMNVRSTTMTAAKNRYRRRNTLAVSDSATLQRTMSDSAADVVDARRRSSIPPKLALSVSKDPSRGASSTAVARDNALRLRSRSSSAALVSTKVSDAEPDAVEEMRRRSDIAEVMKNLDPSEKRNMRMRTWALMDRTPVAQMHTILRVWVLATENRLFKDLREKYEIRKKKSAGHVITGSRNDDDGAASPVVAKNGDGDDEEDAANGIVTGMLLMRLCGMSETTANILFSVVQIIFSMFVVFVFADPLVNTMLDWAKWMGVPSVIPVMFIPLFTSGEVVSSYNWAKGKDKGKISMTYTSLYSAVAMNNCLVFGAFLLMIYANDLAWDFAGESIGLLVSSAVVGTIGSHKFTYSLLHGVVVLSLFPLMGLVIWLFTSTEESRNSATTAEELEDIEDDGPLLDGALVVWSVLAAAAMVSIGYTIYEVLQEHFDSHRQIKSELNEKGKLSWGQIRNTISTTLRFRKLRKEREIREKNQEHIHRAIERTMSQTMVNRRTSVSFDVSDANDHGAKTSGSLEMVPLAKASDKGDETASSSLRASSKTTETYPGAVTLRVVRSIDIKEETKLREAFQRYDTDNDMELDVWNLMNAVDELLGIKLGEDHIKEMIRSVDCDNSGTINFGEFKKLFMAAGTDLNPEAVLDKAFHLFAAPDGSPPDNDASYITVQNLKRVAEMCDVSIQREDLEEMIADANLDGDNKISRDEFRILLRILELDQAA